ncbi:cytochrome P450 2U1-like [Mercenaria mercenaria]|uniref:cytochrome P450 2U1-like n=1 Tax=Mercenaria mercenaria TaxID=6596 RepID=UPI001E1D7250|nr:cytochrome P450 2U1-like [Mercenaria mercenaria]
MIEEIFQSYNFATTFVILLLLLLWSFAAKRPEDAPPGPHVFPILGNIPSLISKDPIRRFTELRNTYGDIYGLYIGKDFTVILNGYDVIHDALVKKGDVFSKRPRSEFHQLMFKEPGIVFANGKEWKENRKFAQLALNEFGYGWTEKSMEERINEEIGHFVDRIETFKQPFDISETVNLSVANVIAGILFGQRCEYDDSKFISCLHSVGEAAKLFARTGLMMSCFPFLKSLPGDLLSLEKIEQVRQKPKIFLNSICKRHSETYDQDKKRNVLDLYMKQIGREQKNGSCTLFTDVNMRVLMGELLSAGSETTATCIVWIILYLIKNPDIQRRLQEELDVVVGSERQPKLEDKFKLPFLEATILEGLRIAPVAPLSVPHAVHDDVTFRGYTIPKETTILVNLHSVLKDPTIWKDPNCFRPDRFLNENGKVTVPAEFIPFSIGRRACLGESLARMELFLYTATLLQRFKLCSAEDGRLPSDHGHLGMTYSPYPFKIRLIRRN